jgi:hypothetical protein
VVCNSQSSNAGRRRRLTAAAGWAVSRSIAQRPQGGAIRCRRPRPPRIEFRRALHAARDFVGEFWPDIALLADRLRRVLTMTSAEVARFLLTEG